MAKGWGLYVGAGNTKLSSAREEKHSGRASACLDLAGWYTSKGFVIFHRDHC